MEKAREKLIRCQVNSKGIEKIYTHVLKNSRSMLPSS